MVSKKWGCFQKSEYGCGINHRFVKGKSVGLATSQGASIQGSFCKMTFSFVSV